jgi:Mn2+/Fe2+ NRAMP family transporter
MPEMRVSVPLLQLHPSIYLRTRTSFYILSSSMSHLFFIHPRISSLHHPSFLIFSSCASSALASPAAPPTLLPCANASIMRATCTAFVRFASSSAGSDSVSRPPNSHSSCKSRISVLMSWVVLIYTSHISFCLFVSCFHYMHAWNRKIERDVPAQHFVLELLIPFARLCCSLWPR